VTLLKKGITLDPHLLIRYISAYVYYVAKDNAELAKTLTQGLLITKADGSFDRLFEPHFKALFERLDLPSRRIIQFNNPLLPEQMLDIEEHPYQYRYILPYRKNAVHQLVSAFLENVCEFALLLTEV